MNHRTPRVLGIALAALALGACSGGDEQGGGAAAGTDTSAAAVQPSAPPPPAGDTAAAGGAMTDANVAAIGSASNQDEIQTSRLALEKTQNAQVRQYAQRMVDDHGRFEQEMTQLLQTKGITPQDNAQSTQMKQTAQAMTQRLQGLSGRALDSAYVAHQVQAHQATLQALETTLIPNAKDPQMKQMLEQARPAVAQHLADAQKLQGSIR